MGVIPGVNAFHAGAAAALVIDGKLVVAIAEERLNRVKHYDGFPARSTVEHPAEAADCRLRTKMDMPALGACSCRKGD